MDARTPRAWRRIRACPDRLSRSSRKDHRPDRSRRQLRSGRTAACGCAVEADGAGLRRREQAGCRHRRRHAGRKPERAGRLHAGGRRALQHGVQFGAVFEARLRSTQGFRAGRADLQVWLRDGRPQGLAAWQAGGHRRRCKGQPGLDFRRDGRRRHRPASGGRCVHEGRGRQIPRSALQGLAAGLHRSARRPHRPVLRLEFGRASLCSIRPGKGHCGAVVETQPAGARRADDVGSRRARPRRQFLARHIRARQNPAGHDRKIAPGNPRRAARTQGSFREERRRGVGSRQTTSSTASSPPNTTTGPN